MITLTSGDLFSKLARALTGREIVIELVESLPGKLGVCFKRNGKFVIQMINENIYPGFLRVFLHECAHIKLQSELFLDNKYSTSGASRSCYTGDGSGEMEDEAEKLCRAWLQYAVNNAWRYSGSESEKVIQALIYRDEIQ